MKKLVILLAIIPVVAMLKLSNAFASTENGIGAGFQMVGSNPSITIKMRGLSVTPLELQYSYILNHGHEVSMNLYILHTKYFKLHLIDPGILLGKTLSGVDVGQQYDISLGGGIEATIWRRLVIFANARVYLPDPNAASKYIDNQTQQAGESTAGQTSDINQIYDASQKAAYNSVNDIYGKALRNYRLIFGAMWFFW